MCRHLAYLGPPRSLHELMYAAPHSLEHQSYAPRMTRGCILNADGFGAGWFADGRPEPVRYRRAQPIWTDVSFREVSEVVRARCAVAAVRSATVGFPVEESGAQPLRWGSRLFSHNGVVRDFARAQGRLRALFGDVDDGGDTGGGGDRGDGGVGERGDAADVPDARAPFDSALLFALTVRLWRAGRPLGDGLAEAVARVGETADGRYNLLAADGSSLAATTWGDSLFVHRRDAGVCLASEPLDDDPGWEPIPDRHLVVADRSAVRIVPL